MPNFYQNIYRGDIAQGSWLAIDSQGAITIDENEYHIPESMKGAIRRFFDDWCIEIVDKKLDANTIDEVIPALNHCKNMFYQLEEQIKEYDKRISSLQKQLEKLQEQMKYLGFERLLME